MCNLDFLKHFKNLENPYLPQLFGDCSEITYALGVGSTVMTQKSI